MYKFQEILKTNINVLIILMRSFSFNITLSIKNSECEDVE